MTDGERNAAGPDALRRRDLSASPAGSRRSGGRRTLLGFVVREEIAAGAEAVISPAVLEDVRDDDGVEGAGAGVTILVAGVGRVIAVGGVACRVDIDRIRGGEDWTGHGEDASLSEVGMGDGAEARTAGERRERGETGRKGCSHVFSGRDIFLRPSMENIGVCGRCSTARRRVRAPCNRDAWMKGGWMGVGTDGIVSVLYAN